MRDSPAVENIDNPFAVPADEEPLPSFVDRSGQTLGAYRLLELIGEGGMGQVYLAEHMRLGRQVALKLMRSEYSDNMKAVSRFFGEARAVNKIHHEHLIDITDFIEEGRDKYYIMELLQGETLLSLLQRKGALPLARILHIMVQVCDALAAVHESGIVHRDMKPDNIFLINNNPRQKDFVKLLDFGVAKLTNENEVINLAKTSAGAILGTPEYMSPEQISGKGNIDARSDIYTIGVILYELVSGSKPFSANSFGEMVIKHMTMAPARLQPKGDELVTVPKELEKLISRCLEKYPEKRPQSMREICSELLAVIESEGLVADYSVTMPVEVQRSRRNFWVPVALLGLVAATGAGYAVYSVGSGSNAVQPPPQHESVKIPAPPAPAPAPVQPAQPAQVTVTFESQPAGAQVFQGDSSVPMGKTPLPAKLAHGDKPLHFIVRKAGYRDSSISIVPLKDSLTKVVLQRKGVKQPKAQKVVGPKKKGQGTQRGKAYQRRGVIDPFEE